MNALACTLLISFAAAPPLSHGVTLLPERTELEPRDPLLMRVDVTFGALRPSYCSRDLDRLSAGFGVDVLSPRSSEYRYIHARGAGVVDGVWPARPAIAPGTRASVYHWIVTHGNDFYVFDKPGDYLVRAVVGLTAVDRKE